MTDPPPPSETTEPATDGATETRRSPERFRVLAPGLYAWLLTVVHPALQTGVSLSARFFAVIAVGALVIGVFLENEYPKLGRWLGIYAFVGSCLFAWTLSGPAVAVGTLDPVRSALGVLGWVIYAFGWGRSRGSRVPEDSPNVVAGAPLAPRARLSWASAPVVGIAIVAALGLEALAFRVDRQEPALLAHAAATAAALLVLGVGSRVALGLGLVWAAFSR